MRTYVSVKLGGIHLPCLRIGGPGLGNILFPWARAKLFSERTGAKFIEPAWSSFKIGPRLRRERDNRNYGILFRTPKRDCLRGLAVKLFVRQMGEPQSIDEMAPLPHTRATNIVFSGMRGQMSDILGHHRYLRQELLKIYKGNEKPCVSTPAYSYIAAHVRLGDFKTAANETELRRGATNTRIPLDWYVEILRKSREIAPNMAIRIYSDGDRGNLQPLLALPNTELVTGGSALDDMLGLADATLLIASNSSYSLWASFLGQPHTCWFPGSLRQQAISADGIFEGEVDYQDDLPSVIAKALSTA